MTCTNCGLYNEENAKFCSNCGAKLNNNQENTNSSQSYNNNNNQSYNNSNQSYNNNNNQSYNNSSQSSKYEKIKEKIESMKTDFDKFFTKKELNELPNVIQDDEDLLYFTSGFHKSNHNTMIIVLTTKRIIFLDKGMFISRRQFDIPLSAINSVQSYSGLMFGELRIVHGAHAEIITYVNKKTVVVFQELATKEIEKFKKDEKTKENEDLANILKDNSSSNNKYIMINGVYINSNSILKVRREYNNIIITTTQGEQVINYQDSSKIEEDYERFISFISKDVFKFSND